MPEISNLNNIFFYVFGNIFPSLQQHQCHQYFFIIIININIQNNLYIF
jgi:hypothetical protein